MADVGQEEDFEAARAKAMKCGAVGFHLADLKREFVEELIYRQYLCCPTETNNHLTLQIQLPFNVMPSTRTSTSLVLPSLVPLLPEA